MKQSKPEETARDAAETRASDALLRHYRKIGSPAVAAALNAGNQTSSGENADRARREADAVAAPSFLDHHAA